MATSSKILCGVCEGQHLTKCADTWCPECDEGLCSDCEKYHSLSKATRNHAAMSIGDYQKLPADIIKIRNHCQDHSRKFEIFCPHHDNLCCPICISLNHKSCSGLMAVDDVVKNSKTSTLMQNLELSVLEIREHIQTIIKDRKQNLIEIESQRKRCQGEIKQKREEINCLLDKLEFTLINELTDAENKIILQIQSLLLQLEERNDTICNLQNCIVAIKTHATDLQTFVGCKTLSEEVLKVEKYIEALSENGSVKQINLKCDISDNISYILTTVTSFGSISVSYNPPSILLTKEKDKQAQIMSAVEVQPANSIDQVSLTISKNLNIPEGNGDIRLTGLDISPTKKVIIVDSDDNERLIIFNQDGSVDRIISLSPHQPYDVTCLDDKIVAVSIFGENLIKLVDIVSGTVSQTVNIDYVCDGITQQNGTLIYCGREHGIILHDPNDKTSTTIVKDQIPDMNHVTIFKDKIYHTNSDTHTVSCYKTSGEKVWDYRDNSILRMPFGVTVDTHSNVYVASERTNSVVILSPDGKHCRQILKEEDGIQQPRAIQFDKDRNVLIVVCYGGDVKMYDVL